TAKRVASAFPNADIEIVETHHNRKVDAPSGTALMLANSIKEVRPEAEYKYGRGGMAKREPNEIGIHALRMANVVGIHEVYITTDSEQIVLKHTAFDRSLFADGALTAGEYISDKNAGIYTMRDIFKS
ncbi:MAG: 4-hydroxy-tetrahydrodipicolinate reductase, partial [Clostridia bacterium]|nr:4-hydroxy-tetrahydrodipicolinate reductase [Clostridia bacterium]